MTFTAVAGYHAATNILQDEWIFHLLCRCHQCAGSVLAWLQPIQVNYGLDALLKQEGPIMELGVYEHLETYPNTLADTTPEHLPTRVRNSLTESINNLSIEGWESAGMMLRKTLQLATREIAEGDKGIDFEKFTNSNLYERIDVLADRMLITPAMKEWAHTIRLEGNEAAHEEDDPFTEDQAVQMKEFTELLLIYAFTLPARMKNVRQSNH